MDDPRTISPTPRLPTIPAVAAPDPDVEAAARARQAELTKPPGSLGRLEDLGVQLAALQRRLPPRVERAVVLVCAADHGVTAEGVSAYPREVTAQMVQNFLRGGAAINRLAEAAGAEVWVLDVGVDADLPAHPRLLGAKVRRGTRNLAREDALTLPEAAAAWEAGRRAAAQLLASGADVFLPGDMGIGNTTAAAALVAALAGAPPEAVVGPGTGVSAAGQARKRAAVAAALARVAGVSDPWARAAAVGGLELIAIAGAAAEAAARGAVVLLDGFPVTAGALLAATLTPGLRPWLVAAHRSAEPGHAVALAALGLDPLLDLRLRLGEGTGAALALPLLRAAAAVFRMATFAEAGVARG